MRLLSKKYISWFVFGFLLFCISFSVDSSSQNDGALNVGYANMDVQECGCSKCHTVELEGCEGCHNSKQVRKDIDDSIKDRNNSEELGNGPNINDSDSDEQNLSNSDTANNIESNKPNSIIPKKSNKDNMN